MYSSQEEDFEQNAFITHKPGKQPKHLPKLLSAQNLAEKCWQKHYQILNNAEEQIAERIIDFIDIFQKDINLEAANEREKEQKDNEAKKQQNKNVPKKTTKNKSSKNKKKGNKNQNNNQSNAEQFIKKPTKLFIPLCIRKSQQEYLDRFISKIRTRLSQFNPEGCQNSEAQKLEQEDKQQQINKNKKKKSKNKQFDKETKTLKHGQYTGIRGARKINIFQHPDYRDVSKIALLMHQKLKQIHINGDISIYLTSNIVQLREDNIYILEEGLAESSCIIIVPTIHSFQQSLIRRFSKNQIIPVNLFSHKQLFYQLMYKCIIDPQIKAYLPKQSLKLLDDFDDFPITYKQGTYRLIHCLQQLQILRKRRDIQFKYIEVDKIFKVIEEALGKRFRFFSDKYWNKKKYIKCILDQNEPFNILDKYTSKNNYYGREQEGSLTQVQLMIKLRQILIRYIERNQEIKDYSSFFKQTKPNTSIKPKGRRDKQLQRYKVDLTNNLDEKGLLQHQIKKLISHSNSQIRRQANFFKWQEYHYIEQLKPMLPYSMVNSVRVLSPIHQQLLQFIYQSISMPLIRVVNQFCVTFKKMQFGQLMYYMKDLQLFGLIDISESTLNPIITPSYFEKATYSNRKIN